MKPKVFNWIAVVFCFWTVIGCATNPDPSKGGFLDGLNGIITGKYEERKQIKQIEIEEAEQQKIQLEKENIALHQQHEILAERFSVYEEKFNTLDGDLKRLEMELHRVRTYNESRSEQKKAAEQNLAKLKKKVEADQALIQNTTEEKMQQAINRLIEDKKRLEQQILDLTSVQ